jgi:uncharacterized protein YbjQ (UPF0145 family)
MSDLIVIIGLLFLGYVFGQLLEKNHYRSIRKRESKLSNIPAIASKILPESFSPCETKLVAGNVVVSVDYYKRFLAKLRNIVGGRVKSYESLIDRARREALLRMKEEAKKVHANYVFNVKMETSSISKGNSESIGSVEVLAYGTAVIQNKPEQVLLDESTGIMNLRPR